MSSDRWRLELEKHEVDSWVFLAEPHSRACDRRAQTKLRATVMLPYAGRPAVIASFMHDHKSHARPFFLWVWTAAAPMISASFSRRRSLLKGVPRLCVVGCTRPCFCCTTCQASSDRCLTLVRLFTGQTLQATHTGPGMNGLMNIGNERGGGESWERSAFGCFSWDWGEP